MNVLLGWPSVATRRSQQFPIASPDAHRGPPQLVEMCDRDQKYGEKGPGADADTNGKVPRG